MAATSGRRPPPRAPVRAPRRRPPLRVRWSRVRLLAVVLTLFVLGMRVVVGEGTDAHSAGTSGRTASAASRAASVKQVCGPPTTSVVRTAPASPGRLTPGPAQAAGPRTVALTFDDGPGEWTP